MSGLESAGSSPEPAIASNASERAQNEDARTSPGTGLKPDSRPFVFAPGAFSQRRLAVQDIWGGLSNVQLWSMIGWRDIKQRYRRSTLGPFWVTLSMAFMVTGLGMVYGTLFKMDLRTYLPFLCLGLILWEFISRSIVEGATSFLMLEGLIKQIRLPLTTHILSTIWRNVIVLAHNAVIFLIVALIFGLNPGWGALLFLPALILILFNLIWIAMLLSIMCTRFRDVSLIVNSVVQMLFFVTPVFWSPSLMPSRTALVHGNPFYHMIDLLRGPLLGSHVELESWIYMSVTLVVGWAFTFLVFTKFRRRIAYWL